MEIGSYNLCVPYGALYQCIQLICILTLFLENINKDFCKNVPPWLLFARDALLN